MTCRCEAYRFPHRWGGGVCTAPQYRCDCGAHFDEPESRTVSGRVGHIDNWTPDETVEWCPECGNEDFEDVRW